MKVLAVCTQCLKYTLYRLRLYIALYLYTRRPGAGFRLLIRTDTLTTYLTLGSTRKLARYKPGAVLVGISYPSLFLMFTTPMKLKPFKVR